MNKEFSYKDHKFILLLSVIPAAIVIYNTSRYWDIYDFSYILDYAYFITVGKIPYRDFLLNTTPGSYFVQAFILKIFGFTLYSQIIYCSLISVLTFLLTYRILFFFNNDKWLNAAIALPVAVTGGYGVLSIPFYDPDCIFFVLISVLITLSCYKRRFPVFLLFIAGLSAFVPFLFKQNIGIAYLFAINSVFIIVLIYRTNNDFTLKKYIWFLTGMFTAIILLLTYLLLTSSYKEFYDCIFGFMFSYYVKARSYSFTQNLSIKALQYTLFVLLIIPALKFLNFKNFWLYITVIILAATPLYLIPVFKLIVRGLNYYEEFLILLPVTINLFAIGALYSFFRLKEIPVFIRTIPLIIIGVIFSAIMSQGYWISHYGIWPLFSILFSCLFLILSRSLFKKHINLLRWIIITNSVLIAVSMFLYINDFQHYIYAMQQDPVDLNKPVSRSVTINLKGLSYPGEVVSNMDNYFKFIQDEIPVNDAILIVPHEDPFYVATGRYPHFPILMNDINLYSYSVEQIIEMINDYNVKWMVVKTGNVLNVLNGSDKGWRFLYPIISHFKDNSILYKSLPDYEIYKIKE